MSQPYNSKGIPVVSQVGGGGGGGLTNINVSAGTTSQNLSNLVFSNGSGVSFGLNGSTITASVAPGGGGLTNINLSAGTTSNNLSAVTFSNSNGVSFGLNGSVVTATVQTNYLTTARASNDAIGLNTAQSNVTWTVNSSGLSLDARGYAGTGTSATNASITLNSNGLAVSVASQSGVNFSAGGTSQNLQSIEFKDANAVTFGLGVGASSRSLTASWALSLYAGVSSNPLQSFVFNNANGVSFGLTGSTITASHNGLTTARASNDAIGLNTAQSNVTWTVNSSGLSLDARGYAGTGTSATNASVTLNSNGLAISVAAPGGGGAVNFSAGTTSNNLQSVEFQNANGISFGLNTGASSRSITASHNGLTTARASNDAIGLNTAQTNVTWTVNSSGLSFNAAGYAGTGTSRSGNLSFTLNSNGLALNASNLAGTTTGFTGANISGSMTHNTDGLAVSLSVAAPGGGAGATVSEWYNFINFANSTAQANWPGTGTSGNNRVWGFELFEHLAANMFSVPVNMTFGTAGTSSGSRTNFVYAGIYTRGTGASTSLMSQLFSNSFSICMSANNSSLTFNHPTSTNSAGYTTGTTSSAGFNISSGYTGVKAVAFPIGAQTLTPGKYYLVLGAHASTAGGTGVGISGTWLGLQHSGTNLAPMGSFSSAFTSGSNLTRWLGGDARGMINGAIYSSTNALPATMAMSGFTAGGGLGQCILAIFSSR